MTDAAPPGRILWKEAITIACALVGAGTIIGNQIKDAGGRDARIADNTRRIILLEQSVPDQQKTLTAILERTARIETKLEMIAPMKAQRP